ncbi:MAG: DNA-processing protein DprA [Clostridia bacterium]|nr:DNA-processing protein DprA [Clostridia bacterium]
MKDASACTKWLWLSFSCALTKSKMLKLYDCFENIDNIFAAVREDYEKLSFLKADDIEKLCQKDLTQVLHYEKKLAARGISVLTRDMELFPDGVKELKNFPSVLYCKGKIKKLCKDECISIVGSRTPGSYGKNITYEISRSVSQAGLIVVSGMADGVDSIAHRAALDAGGYTVAVLGCGVDVIYPQGNFELYERICQNGLIISEYMPGKKPERFSFPERNKIIASLSRSTVVTEANSKSGSLITAADAIGLGRDLFAVPGNITSSLSGGTNELIKKGAIPITGANDVCEYYNISVSKQNTDAAPVTDDPKERMVLDSLSERPLSIDEICYKTALSLSELNSILLIMEVKDLIKKTGADLYTPVLK